MENVIGNDSETVLEIRQRKLGSFVVISTLVLNYEIRAAGYYWCTVMNANYPTPNPSQVLNISTCPFNGDTTSLNLVKCNHRISLFDTPRTARCANYDVSIDTESMQLGSCADVIDDKGSITTTTLHGSESLPTTDSYKTEERTFPDFESTILPSSVFPMRYVWMIVGIAFALLIAIIIIVLIAIVYLNHKKKKIKGT